VSIESEREGEKIEMMHEYYIVVFGICFFLFFSLINYFALCEKKTSQQYNCIHHYDFISLGHTQEDLINK
jgi:quinol-cytochrome oxidoreductase complex cytochrome b subunit